MSESQRRLGRVLLPIAAFGLGIWRCAGLPMPTDTGFHLVRAGNRMLEGSMQGWAVPPGGEHATPLGALVAAFGALFADTSEAKLLVSGCVLFGFAAAILVRALAQDGLVIAITGLACFLLPPSFASSFGSRPDGALGGVLLLIAAARALRDEPPVRVLLPTWTATLATPWAIPAAIVSHAKHVSDVRALVAPAGVVVLLAVLSAAIPPAGRGEVIRGLFGDVDFSGRGPLASILALRHGWTEAILFAAFLASQIPQATRLPVRVLVPWLSVAAAVFLFGGPGAWLGATATLAPIAALGLARAGARVSDANAAGSVPRPVVFILLLSLLASFLGAEPDQRRRTEMRAIAAREAQIGAFLWQEESAPGPILASRTGALAAFSGRPAHAIRGADLPDPPPRWVIFSRGARPGNDSERALFTNPEFLASYAPYPIRRGRRLETWDEIWILRAAPTSIPPPAYSASLADAWSAADASDSITVMTLLDAAVALEPPDLGLAREELALAWVRHGDGVRSRAVFEEARLRDPACVRARAHLADRAISRGEIVAADSLVAELFAFHRGLAEYHGVRARLFAHAGWAKEAEAESDRAVRAGPDVPRLLVNHGIFLWRRGAASEARGFWRRAVQVDRSALRYLGDFEKAPDTAPCPPLGPVLSDFDFQATPAPVPDTATDANGKEKDSSSR